MKNFKIVFYILFLIIFISSCQQEENLKSNNSAFPNSELSSPDPILRTYVDKDKFFEYLFAELEKNKGLTYQFIVENNVYSFYKTDKKIKGTKKNKECDHLWCGYFNSAEQAQHYFENVIAPAFGGCLTNEITQLGDDLFYMTVDPCPA